MSLDGRSLRRLVSSWEILVSSSSPNELCVSTLDPLNMSGVLWSQARCGIREPGHFYWKWPIDNGLCENSERMDTDPLSTHAAERWDVGAGLGTVGGAWILALLKPQAVTAALLKRQQEF